MQRSIPINLTLEVIKKMSLISLARMSRTCRRIHELMERHLEEFNIISDKKLEFILIDDLYREIVSEDGDREYPDISEDHNIDLNIIPSKVTQSFNSLKAEEAMKNIAFVRFRKANFFITDWSDEIMLNEEQLRQIFTGFEANKITVNRVTMPNGNMIEEAIRILKPRRLSCHIGEGHIISPQKPTLWSTLEDVKFGGYFGENLFKDVIPHCRKVKLIGSLSMDDNETEKTKAAIKQLVQKIIRRSVHNKELLICDIFEADEWDDVIDGLSSFANSLKVTTILDLEGNRSHGQKIIILIPLEKNPIGTPPYLTIFFKVEDWFRGKLKYFLASTWKDIEREDSVDFEWKLANKLKPHDMMSIMTYFHKDLGIKLLMEKTTYPRYTETIPVHLSFEIIKKMNLNSFTRMRQTCRKVNELINGILKEFHFHSEKELNFNIISDAHRKYHLEEWTSISAKDGIQISIFSTEFAFFQKDSLQSIESILDELSFITFSKINLFAYNNNNKIRPFNGEIHKILSALKAKMTTYTTISVNGNLLNEAINILKPKKLHYVLFEGEIISPDKSEIWYSLDKVYFDNCNAGYLMSNVVPYCREVEMRAAFPGEWTEWNSSVFTLLLQNILISNCYNVEFDGYFPMAPHKILECLSIFHSAKLQKAVSNDLDVMYILPMATNVHACLVVFVSSHFGGDFGTTRIQYFLAYTWNDVISRKMHSFNHQDTDITNIFDPVSAFEAMLFFETEIFNIGHRYISFPVQVDFRRPDLKRKLE